MGGIGAGSKTEGQKRRRQRLKENRNARDPIRSDPLLLLLRPLLYNEAGPTGPPHFLSALALVAVFLGAAAFFVGAFLAAVVVAFLAGAFLAAGWWEEKVR